MFNKINGHDFFYQKMKNRVSSRLLAKTRVSQVFWEPIKNGVPPRSVLLETVYLKALLYLNVLMESNLSLVIPMDRIY